MSEQGGVRWWVRMLLDPKSRKDLEKEMKDTAEKAGQDMGEAATRSESSWLRAAKRIGVALVAAFSIHKIRQWGQAVINEFRNVERSSMRLRGVWEANAGAVRRTFEEIQRFAREVRSTTLFQTEEIELAIAQLLTYKSISGDTFERTIRLGTNLASVFGNLTQATAAVARALDDPIRGLGDLRRQGFTFEAQVESQIRTLTEQGRLLEAQTIILSTLEAEVGNVAETMRTGLNRALDDARKKGEDFRVKFGEMLVTGLELEKWVDRAGARIGWLTENLDELAAAAINVVRAIMVVGTVVALNRLRVAVLAANVATVTFLGTLRSFYALIGPKGWFILGVASVATAFQKAGRAAREAAKDAKDAHDAFTAALSGMSKAQIDAEERLLREQRRDILEAIAELEQQRDEAIRKAVATGSMVGGEEEALRINELRARLVQITARQRAVQAQIVRSMEAEAAASGDVVANASAELKLISERVSLLARAHSLAILSRSEWDEATELATRLRGEIERGNHTLEERIRLQELLNTLIGIGAEPGRPTVEIAPLLPKRPPLPELDPVESLGVHRARVEAARAAFDAEFEHLRDQWAGVESAALSAAFGVTGAWGDAFALLRQEGASFGDFMEAITRGSAAAMLGSLGQVASYKVAENIARGFEEKAKAGAAAAMALSFPWMFAEAAAHSAASSAAFLAAGKWAVLGAGAGAGAGLVGGGGRGGLSGGVPTGARDIGGRLADQARVPEIHNHIYLDPLSSRNPVFVRTVGEAGQAVSDTYGQNVRLYPRDQGGR